MIKKMWYDSVSLGVIGIFSKLQWQNLADEFFKNTFKGKGRKFFYKTKYTFSDFVQEIFKNFLKKFSKYIQQIIEESTPIMDPTKTSSIKCCPKYIRL